MMAAINRMSGMQLSELLANLFEPALEIDCVIQRLMLDSRKVRQGDLFIAVPGHSVDGRTFINDAISQGASAILWQSEQGTVPIPIAWRTSPDDRSVPVIAIDNLKDKVGVLADRFYHEPSKSMYVVGITGTNGKTSCSQFIAQALATKISCGVIGTMGWGFVNNLRESNHTTPDAITCHQWLADMYQSGARAAAIEVSSHALDQGRVNNVHFDCAVFTNLSHEHLDYHGDMQSYGRAKAKLFVWDSVKKCIINQDDEYGRQLIAELSSTGKTISYGIQNAKNMPDLYADEVVFDQQGISATIHSKYGKARLHSKLFGLFNIYNLLATLGVLLHIGLDFNTAMRRLESIRPIRGRMQVIRQHGQPTAIIDYAHTPDALEQVLKAVRQHQFGTIWCVFGCGGDRDRAKRPRMGAIAEQYADQVVLTDDNPRTESPDEILGAILQGMQTRQVVVIEHDRKKAITYAIEHAAQQDVVVIAGKGHEDYQIVGSEKLPFSDFAVVTDILRGARQ